MKKLVLPALGAALVFGGMSAASAQFLLPGQPGWTGPANRTVPPGTPTSGNIPGGSFQTGPSGLTSQPAPQLSRPEFFEPVDRAPGEVDAAGRISPTNERRQARFIGERGPDGKLLPTYQPQSAQAAPPQQQTPPQQQMNQQQRQQMNQRQPTIQEQTRDRDRGQATSGTMGPQDRAVERPMQGQRSGQQMQQQQQRSGQPGQTQRSRQMDRQGAGDITRPGMGEPPNATAMLNNLSAQGYRPAGNFTRSGDVWMAPAVKDGRQVTVIYDPRTQQISER